MLQLNPRPRAPVAAIAVAFVFLAASVAGAFPLSGPCRGESACLCCADAGSECACPPSSPCGCRDAVKGEPEQSPLPTVGVPATLAAGTPTVPPPDAGPSGAPVRPGTATSRPPAPETPPPES
jgi:hypothetical protein